MSQEIISVFVILLSAILPKIGVTIGNDALTTTLTTILTVASAIVIWVRRHQQGDIKWYGAKKAE